MSVKAEFVSLELLLALRLLGKPSLKCVHTSVARWEYTVSKIELKCSYENFSYLGIFVLLTFSSKVSACC